MIVGHCVVSTTHLVVVCRLVSWSQGSVLSVTYIIVHYYVLIL